MDKKKEPAMKTSRIVIIIIALVSIFSSNAGKNDLLAMGGFFLLGLIFCYEYVDKKLRLALSEVEK